MNYIKGQFIEAKQNFRYDEMAYHLLFGLAPTACDIISDLLFGLDLERQGDTQEAGLVFLFVANPGIVFLWGKVWRQVSPKRPELAIILIFNLALLITILYPSIFKYIAILVSIGFLLVKILAVFIQTKEMKKLSQTLSDHECIYESPLQLFILLNIWLSTGRLYLSAIMSSVIVIGKVASENYLNEEDENNFRSKSSWKKMFSVFQYIPVMSLTTIFRVGSGALFLHPPTLFKPFSPLESLLLNQIFFFLPLHLLMFSILTLLKLWYPSIGRLSSLEIFHALNGEVVTITVWPKVIYIKAVNIYT